MNYLEVVELIIMTFAFKIVSLYDLSLTGYLFKMCPHLIILRKKSPNSKKALYSIFNEQFLKCDLI